METVHGGGIYKHGEIAVVQAIPEEGYLFNGWTGASVEDPGGCIHTAGNNHRHTTTCKF